ncbi:hypothetical protein [Thiomicrorhabdus sp.]|uniref:hypothetical protein n=1 Tax=Thiomicrorhabdus sp. TaxID=2039724 RepID=UPI0035659E84
MMKPFFKMTGLVAAAATVLTLSACSTVKTQEIDKETYYLTEFYHEPFTTFESWSLRRKAKEFCPIGYKYLLRKAGKSSEFAKQHFECFGGKDCEYALEWRIQCTDQPEEKFSFFGKS